ncbi:MAG: FKBP-type peptidyl-prolyl cis-trans isomerase [Alphaproteobacteria bacterium]|nr:MAG: FKBP-type peptidyl-prolyl cis-trans isomerase [Alphaproteobacteria bacterium]
MTRRWLHLTAVLLPLVWLVACGDRSSDDRGAPAEEPASSADAAAGSAAPAADESATVGAIDMSQWLARGDVVKRPSGLAYRVLRHGEGAGVPRGAMVIVHYEGRFLDGRVFDSSYARGEPARFPSDRLIPGWVEALSLMHEGDKWELLIPARLGYGSRGAGKVIPPDTPLFFTVELIGVEGNAAPAR